jgi:hypothetical protein
MPRKLFAMSLDASSTTGVTTVLERAFTEQGARHLGRVEASSYLEPGRAGFWQRLMPWRNAATLRPPFDGAGHDIQGLLAAHPPVFEGEEDPPNAIRMVRGTVSALAPREHGDEVVVRDAWSVEQGARLVSGLHFGLTRPDLPPVAVAFAMCPLIVAMPMPMPLRSVIELGPLNVRAFTNFWPALDLDREGTGVELLVGDEIEVIGLVSRPEDCDGRFDVDGRRASYRDAAVTHDLTLVIGDRPGLRMVIRRC